MYGSHHARSEPTYIVRLYIDVNVLEKLGDMIDECATSLRVTSIDCSCNRSMPVVWNHFESAGSSRTTSPQYATRSKLASIDCVCNRPMPVIWGRYNYLRSSRCATSSKTASTDCGCSCSMPVVGAHCHIVSMISPRSWQILSLLTLCRQHFILTNQFR